MACKCCELCQHMNEVALHCVKYLPCGALALEDKGSSF